MRICVIVLNWNGWADTLECLESVFRTDLPGITVVVCDNDSSDGSVEHIRLWAEGRLNVWMPEQQPLRPLSHPPVPKPISYVEYDREAAERGGNPLADAPLVLIRTGDNLGFAGGNNVGLRFALARGGWDAVWLLNNDTVVRPDSLTPLVRELERDPTVGMVGSTLLYYDAPNRVQALGGGRYNKWLALTSHVGAHEPVRTDIAAEEITPALSYIAAASMLVPVSFLREVGLMSEDYFLYFEELDWALRARGKFRLAYAPDSVVYHREGSSIGGGERIPQKSSIADYCSIRGRILLTRKYVLPALPTVYLGLLVAMARRVRRRQWDRVRMIAQLMWSA